MFATCLRSCCPFHVGSSHRSSCFSTLSSAVECCLYSARRSWSPPGLLDLREDRSAAEVESLQTLILTMVSVCLLVCSPSSTAQTAGRIRTKFAMHTCWVHRRCAHPENPKFEFQKKKKSRKTVFGVDSAPFGRHFLSN